MQLTIVIPTYNEAENLPKMISALFQLPIPDLKIIVVDDNSPDQTGLIADEYTDHFPGRISVIHRAGKLGLGSAYIQGFQKAMEDGAEAVGQMDADFSHSPDKVVPMLSALESCDVVLGSRYIQGGGVDKKWPVWRKGLSSFGNIYARMILNLPIRDTTGGFRIWRSQTLRNMPLERVRSNGYAFQVEMTYVAHCSGFRFKEVPIYFEDRRWGDSKMSFQIQLEAAIRVWQLLWEYRDLKEVS
ncbi:MAG: polyprenol monophosphomannose synthase [Anaerolineales bacterium]|jgi:dolichol-phosphate mannosyltransferase